MPWGPGQVLTLAQGWHSQSSPGMLWRVRTPSKYCPCASHVSLPLSMWAGPILSTDVKSQNKRHTVNRGSWNPAVTRPPCLSPLTHTVFPMRTQREEGLWLIQISNTVLSMGSMGMPHGQHSSKERGQREKPWPGRSRKR